MNYFNVFISCLRQDCELNPKFEGNKLQELNASSCVKLDFLNFAPHSWVYYFIKPWLDNIRPIILLMFKLQKLLS